MSLTSGARRTILADTGTLPQRERTSGYRPDPTNGLGEPPLDVGKAFLIRHVRICAIVHVYRSKVNDFVLALIDRWFFGEMRLAGLSFHMELLAKLSFQVGAARWGRQWIPARGGKGMVPLLAKLWFKPHVSEKSLPNAPYFG